MTKFCVGFVTLHFEVFKNEGMIFDIGNLVIPDSLATFRPFGYPKKPRTKTFVDKWKPAGRALD